MKRFLSLIFSLLLVSAMALPVQAQSLRDVINALEIPFRIETPAAASVHDVEADFYQESTIASLNRTQQGSGKVTLRFDRPRTDKVPLVKFRWEYERPTRQEIVSDGETMWVYIPENNQVIQSDISEVSEARPQDPMTFLTGLGNLSEDFFVKWASPDRDEEGNYIIELEPRTTTSLFTRLEVVVDRYVVNDYVREGVTGREFPIHATVAVDPNDNRTMITFDRSSIRLNRGVSDFEFDFMMPAGVDVVRPSGDRMGY